MKRFLVAGAVAAFAMVGFSSTAQAAPAQAACFGQVHKLVNSGGLPGIDNVGQLVGALGGGHSVGAAVDGPAGVRGARRTGGRRTTGE